MNGIRTQGTVILLRPEFVEEARKLAATNSENYHTFPYMQPRYAKSTGRAKCRCCGQAIAKNEEAIKFSWDFHNQCGYTAVYVWLHKDCQAVRP